MLLTSGLVERCFLLVLMVATERYYCTAKCQIAYFARENRVFPFKNEVEGKYAFFTAKKRISLRQNKIAVYRQKAKRIQEKKWRRRNKEKEERAKRLRNPRFHSDGYPPAEE